MTFEHILYKKETGIARLIINRPDKRNALNRAARLEMLEALEDTTRDRAVKVLILSGAGGKSFVAGSDLNELARMNPLETGAFFGHPGPAILSPLRANGKTGHRHD